MCLFGNKIGISYNIKKSAWSVLWYVLFSCYFLFTMLEYLFIILLTFYFVNILLALVGYLN